MTFEITIGTDKQIEFAKDIIAKRAHASMGGNCYHLEAGMKWIADYRAFIESSAAPQALKDRAVALLEVLPTVAVFWIQGAGDDTRRVIEAILSGRTAGVIGDAVDLYKALTS